MDSEQTMNIEDALAAVDDHRKGRGAEIPAAAYAAMEASAAELGLDYEAGRYDPYALADTIAKRVRADG